MKNKELIIIVIITIFLFSISIYFSYYISNKTYNIKFKEEIWNLTNCESDIKYDIKQEIIIGKNEKDLNIDYQDIFHGNNFLGYQYSLDGINYTSTITNDSYTFKYLKNINEIDYIYVKIIDNNYDEILTCKYLKK